MSPADEFARAEPVLRDRVYATIESDPGFLFDHDGGPYGIKADIILARLIGHDDQIVRDDLRLDRIRDVLLEPIFPKVTAVAAPDILSMPRTAEYRLRSGYATVELDPAAIWPPQGIRPDPANGYRYKVLFLRYKRRL